MELIAKAPIAITKLTNKKTVTKKEIAALLYVKYNLLIKLDKYSKPALMQIFVDKVRLQPAFISPANPKYILENFCVSDKKEPSNNKEESIQIHNDVDVNFNKVDVNPTEI